MPTPITLTPTPETIVGHTTLATGADPAAHGMIGNVRLDRQTGKLTSNIEDRATSSHKPARSLLP